MNTGWWEAFAPPFQWTLDNYVHVLTDSNIGQGFFKSITIAFPSTIMPILVAAFAAYAPARLRFPGRDTVFLVIVGLLVIPLQITLVPVLRIFNTLNLTGRFPAVWIAIPPTVSLSRYTCVETTFPKCRPRSLILRTLMERTTSRYSTV